MIKKKVIRNILIFSTFLLVGFNEYSIAQQKSFVFNNMFGGDKLTDLLMLSSFNKDERKDNNFIIYTHGHKYGLAIHFNSGLKLNKNKLSDLELDNQYVFIHTIDQFVNLLEENNIDLNNYDAIEIRSCDVGLGHLPQEIANHFNKTVYAADDFYFFSNLSVGVKYTIRFSWLENTPYLRLPIKKDFLVFKPEIELVKK